MKKQIRTCSPVMDLNTQGVWQLFSATNWNVSDTYEKMHESGIPIDLQRTGTLLNYCAVRSVATIKTLEPEMYAKINSRFQNVEFIASFSKSGYYHIAKPVDVAWSGGQHIKAGRSVEDCTKLTDKYEDILKAYGCMSEEEFNKLSESDKIKKFLSNYGIFYKRKNNSIRLKRSLELTKKLGSALMPITPFQIILENWDNLEKTQYSKEEIQKLGTIHTTWYDYCLFLLNTSDDPAKSIWRQKLVTSILSWKYNNGSVEPSTIDALNIMSEIDPKIVEKLTDDYWTKDDYHVGGVLSISGKTCLSLSHYPQQSLEMEVQDIIEWILKNKRWDIIDKSESLKKIIEKFETTDYKTMLSPTQVLMVKYGNDYVKQKNKVDENTEKNYDSIIKFENIKNINENSSQEEKKKLETWINRISNGNKKWFKEQIHSTSSWKRFAINILKGDITGKYLGFGPSSSERLIRAQAMQAFSQHQEDKEKARKEAERLAKQIEEENKDK